MQIEMIKTLTLFSFLLMLIVGLVLPSDGNHGILAPKSLAFLNAALFFTIYTLSRFKCSSSQAYSILAILFACFFFGIWYLVGIGQDPLVPSGQFDQFKVFMTTLFVPFAAFYLLEDGLLTPQTILRTAIYSQAVYCTVKVFLMVLHLLKVINVWTFMHYTGLRFMSMAIVGDVGRIQTSVDILTPFLVYFVLMSDKMQLGLSPWVRRYFLFISLGSTFLSFSRYLMAVYAASVFLYGLTLPLLKQTKFWIATAIVLTAMVFAAGPEKVWKAVEMRLFSDNNYQSDAERRVQINALMDQCDRYPFLGTGLGGYTKECIRDHALPHAYEVQWVAFLMQFGLIGILVLLAPLSYIGFKILYPSFNRFSLALFALYLLWLLSGFTNPFLISLTSGIAYTLFLIAPMSSRFTNNRVTG